MKVGDIVRIKNTRESADWFNFYVNSDAKIVNLESSGCNVELFDGSVVFSPLQHLEPIYNIYKKEDNCCECGAKATSFPNFHADYCPLYKDMR